MQALGRYIHKSETLQEIRFAYYYALIHHQQQYRNSGEPYIIHPLTTAQILAEWRMEPMVIIVGLLHDILEDTPVSYKDLVQVFGEKIASLVQAVTKVSFFAKDNREQISSLYLRRLYLAMAQDVRVIIVKLADRLHNMKTISFLEQRKQQVIAAETLRTYAPIAHRLGMNSVQRELANLSFKVLEPETDREIKAWLQSNSLNQEQLLQEKRRAVKQLLTKNHIEAQVLARIKSTYSIYQKMIFKARKIDDIKDIFAIRIICDTTLNCYLILGIIHEEYVPLKNEFKDYIASPKANLYQSLHTIIVFPDGQLLEVQIRTKEMDLLAEQGLAAHWRYKENEDSNNAAHHKMLDDQISVFSHILDLSKINEEEADTQQTVTNVKQIDKLTTDVQREVFSHVVYALTPMSKVVTLPYGSRVLDFAYAIHSELGDHTVGAKINGVMMPLSTIIQSGDVVDIKTNPRQKPNANWLKIVTTSRARNKIKKAVKKTSETITKEINEQNRNEKIRMIRRQINIALNRADQHNISLFSPSEQEEKLKAVNLNDLNDLAVSIADGHYSFKAAMEKFLINTNPDIDNIVANIQASTPPPRQSTAHAINIGGMKGIQYNLAKCCNPVPGEPIIGFITKTSGIKIHRQNCNLLSPSSPRKLQVDWNDIDHNLKQYQVGLSIIVWDRKSLMADIVNLLNQQGIKMTKIQGHLDRNITARGHIIINIQVSNFTQLNRVILAIQNLQSVQSVERKGN